MRQDWFIKHFPENYNETLPLNKVERRYVSKQFKNIYNTLKNLVLEITFHTVKKRSRIMLCSTV